MRGQKRIGRGVKKDEDGHITKYLVINMIYTTVIV